MTQSITIKLWKENEKFWEEIKNIAKIKGTNPNRLFNEMFRKYSRGLKDVSPETKKELTEEIQFKLKAEHMKINKCKKEINKLKKQRKNIYKASLRDRRRGGMTTTPISSERYIDKSSDTETATERHWKENPPTWQEIRHDLGGQGLSNPEMSKIYHEIMDCYKKPRKNPITSWLMLPPITRRSMDNPTKLQARKTAQQARAQGKLAWVMPTAKGHEAFIDGERVKRVKKRLKKRVIKKAKLNVEPKPKKEAISEEKPMKLIVRRETKRNPQETREVLNPKTSDSHAYPGLIANDVEKKILQILTALGTLVGPEVIDYILSQKDPEQYIINSLNKFQHLPLLLTIDQLKTIEMVSDPKTELPPKIADKELEQPQPNIMNLKAKIHPRFYSMFSLQFLENTDLDQIDKEVLKTKSKQKHIGELKKDQKTPSMQPEPKLKTPSTDELLECYGYLPISQRTLIYSIIVNHRDCSIYKEDIEYIQTYFKGNKTIFLIEFKNQIRSLFRHSGLHAQECNIIAYMKYLQKKYDIKFRKNAETEYESWLSEFESKKPSIPRKLDEISPDIKELEDKVKLQEKTILKEISKDKTKDKDKQNIWGSNVKKKYKLETLLNRIKVRFPEKEFTIGDILNDLNESNNDIPDIAYGRIDNYLRILVEKKRIEKIPNYEYEPKEHKRKVRFRNIKYGKPIKPKPLTNFLDRCNYVYLDVILKKLPNKKDFTSSEVLERIDPEVIYRYNSKDYLLLVRDILRELESQGKLTSERTDNGKLYFSIVDQPTPKSCDHIKETPKQIISDDPHLNVSERTPIKKKSIFDEIFISKDKDTDKQIIHIEKTHTEKGYKHCKDIVFNRIKREWPDKTFTIDDVLNNLNRSDTSIPNIRYRRVWRHLRKLETENKIKRISKDEYDDEDNKLEVRFGLIGIKEPIKTKKPTNPKKISSYIYAIAKKLIYEKNTGWITVAEVKEEIDPELIFILDSHKFTRFVREQLLGIVDHRLLAKRKNSKKGMWYFSLPENQSKPIKISKQRDLDEVRRIHKQQRKIKFNK